MATTHIVAEGEHLAGIAAHHGFSKIGPIWHHPENAKLKELRKNPNILFAGDRVFIPDRETKDVSKATDARHQFVAAAEALELHVKVHDQGFQPIHGDAEMTAGSTKVSMRQRGDVFEAPLRSDAKDALLDFPISKSARQRPQLHTQPGRLDPIETLPGQQQRLNNLGYFAGFVKTQATDPKKIDLQLRWAVEEFQRDHMGQAQVDGVLGPNTLKRLKEVHGC